MPPHSQGSTVHYQATGLKRRINVRPNSILRFTFSLLLILTMLAPVLQAAPPVGVTVAIDPVNLTMPVGSTRQYSVKVVGATNTAVTWTINNLPGGDATVGTISGTGFYM